MRYCNNCDIAYEERRCPLCEAKDEIRELSDKIEELTEKLAESENKNQ